MAKKQLAIVVEGTTTLKPNWPTIFKDYITNIIRSFCGNGYSIGQKSSGAPLVALGLVVFNTHKPCMACSEQGVWTRNLDAFLKWLSNLTFSDGGSHDGAVTEGLSDALLIFSRIPTETQRVQRHCILVAASNPCHSPILVCLPTIQYVESSGNYEAQTECYLLDTEMMAQTFIQYSVSLSVISPKQLPTLKAIYDVGNTNAQAADPSVNDAKNPEFLVLLSKNFVEALTALDRLEITSVPSFQSLGGCALDQQEVPSFQSLLEMEADWVTPDLEPTTPTFTDDDIILLRQLISEPNQTQPKSPPENILTATVNMEVEPAFPQIPYVPPGTSQSGSGSQQTPRPWDEEKRYVKVREGDLTALVYGQSIPVSRLVVCSVSYRLAANWPNTLQLSDQLIPQNSIDNLPYNGPVDYLVLEAMNDHIIFEKLRARMLCANVKLPSQTMILSASNKNCCLIGTLFPGDGPLVRSQNSGIQQQQ